MAIKGDLIILALIICSGDSYMFTTTHLDSRIVGGDEISIKKAPYQVSLHHFDEHFCGGVILNRKFILTAAHCFMKHDNVEEIKVRVGSSEINWGGMTFDADFYSLHPDYPEDHSDTTDYDVALIKLAYPLKFSEDVQPIMMVNEDFEPVTGSKAYVNGWGRIQFGGQLSRKLRGVEIEITDLFDCFLNYMDLSNVTERQVCAGIPILGGKDSCTGDSGGPLTINGVLAGIVSYGLGCAYADYPGVYSNIAQYRSWIDNFIKSEM